MEINNEDYVRITNKWYWGVSVDIVRKNGIGIVCVKYDDNFPLTAFICDLTVHVDYRGKGVGNELINYAMTDALFSGMKFVQLCVDKNNVWLIAWYKRLGFEILSQDEHEYTMLKHLYDDKSVK